MTDEYLRTPTEVLPPTSDGRRPRAGSDGILGPGKRDPRGAADIALREDVMKQAYTAQWNRDIGVDPGAVVKSAGRMRKESKRGRREFSRDLKVSAGEKWRT
ncbi:hypothetical protein C8Q74DRAFT_413053 [Fomes fomentarius]|nr:hypothetical protein C8Q74DRAFT_413053 [Fomes fomentarius]